MIPPGESIEWACALEVLAAKPGNVSPGREFKDLCVADFLLGGLAIAPILSRTAELGVGKAILESVRASKEMTRSNANLGIILLLAPLCAADAPNGPTPRGVRGVLDSLTVEDARLAYEAIREARPGGMGNVEQQDIQSEPTVTLLETMRLAADRDSVARMYVNGFQEVFELGPSSLEAAIVSGRGLEEAIVWCHLQWMAWRPDTLIERKVGVTTARESQQRAQNVMDAASRKEEPGAKTPSPGFLSSREIVDFDAWLRADGHNRNPGTSADLVAASLFVAIRGGKLDPKTIPWTRG